MREKFGETLDQMKQSLVDMGARSGRQLARALEAFLALDHDTARAVVAADDEIDSLEIEHEKRIVQLLARQAPVAKDLRFLVASLRINGDIERVGDLATKIAKNALRIPPGTRVPELDNIEKFGELAKTLWADAMHAFVKEDADLSAVLRSRDAVLNRANSELVRTVASTTGAGDDHVQVISKVIAVGKHLERVGDNSVDVANEVIYIARGELVRHSRASIE